LQKTTKGRIGEHARNLRKNKIQFFRSGDFSYIAYVCDMVIDCSRKHARLESSRHTQHYYSLCAGLFSVKASISLEEEEKKQIRLKPSRYLQVIDLQGAVFLLFFKIYDFVQTTIPPYGRGLCQFFKSTVQNSRF
jgi:hypothetical protein